MAANNLVNATNAINTNKINMSTLYKIVYTNHFKVENKTFAFRNKCLFDITENPVYLPLKDNNGSKGYWLCRKWYSITKIKDLIVKEPIEVDLSGITWYIQEYTNHCINLEMIK